jgi:hypothetical protein
MTNSERFRVRLRVRIGKALTTDELSLSTTVRGREVSIKSQRKDQPLSEATWIVLGARDFTTEFEGHEFGTQLRSIFKLAALCTRLGTDAGQDKASTHVNEEFARSLGLVQPHERIMPNIHGLVVIPDDENTRFPLIEATGKITSSPTLLLETISEIGRSAPFKLATASLGVDLLNQALITPQPLAQTVLAFAAVEALGQNEKWSAAQLARIEQLATEVEQKASETDNEALEVANALRRSLHRVGLRQGVKRILADLGLGFLMKRWDELYELRSGLFHGTAKLTEPEIAKLANDSVSLCGVIILRVAEREGLTLPRIASTNFLY